jgi:hypothetical protein
MLSHWRFVRGMANWSRSHGRGGTSIHFCLGMIECLECEENQELEHQIVVWEAGRPIN